MSEKWQCAACLAVTEGGPPCKWCRCTVRKADRIEAPPAAATVGCEANNCDELALMGFESCAVHLRAAEKAWLDGEKRGGEAEELRKGIETLTEQSYDEDELRIELRKLLDRVDARDSLAFLERGDRAKAVAPVPTDPRPYEIHFPDGSWKRAMEVEVTDAGVLRVWWEEPHPGGRDAHEIDAWRSRGDWYAPAAWSSVRQVGAGRED